jgi:lipoprotein-releasing system ATP-binding protein
MQARANTSTLKVVEGSPKPSVGELRVSDLRKSFTSPVGERIEVLRGVELRVAPGEMVAVTGASGSGKSTLLHLIGGLDEADHGSVELNRFVVSNARGGELDRFRRRHIGFIFQFHHLLPDLTAAENVAMPLLISRMPFRKAIERSRQVLNDVGLGTKWLDPIGHLSGGEQQRAAVARAIIGEPMLILADEPTGNLDVTAGEEIAFLLHEYCRSREALVLIATHNPEIARACDRTVSIRDGKII